MRSVLIKGAYNEKCCVIEASLLIGEAPSSPVYIVIHDLVVKSIRGSKSIPYTQITMICILHKVTRVKLRAENQTKMCCGLEESGLEEADLFVLWHHSQDLILD